jgi:regulator of ribonuclease activity A
VVTSPLLDYGGLTRFAGPAVVARCHGPGGPDPGPVVELCASPGEGRVLVVEAAGLRSRAVLDRHLAAAAAGHGWAGLVVHGVVRDVEALRTLEIGIKALGASPRGSTARGGGELDVPVEFGSVRFATGDHVYADETGVVVSATALDLPGAVP